MWLGIRSIRHMHSRLFSSLRKKPFPPPPTGPVLRQDERVDEEKIPGYRSKDFYPAKPGEVLADRYQVLVKVGWGVSSTVWLGRDMQGDAPGHETGVVMKILNCNEPASEEREVEAHIAKANPSHHGYSFLRTSKDCFEVEGPEGKHICLAYAPMRETLRLYQRRFVGNRIPFPILKYYIRFLLSGLDYLHECNVVHTDLKLENIMVTFEDKSVFSQFMNSASDQPMEYKIDPNGRPVYRHRNDFGALKNAQAVPMIVDFGNAARFEDGQMGILPIQPHRYRAPEAILGCAWTVSTDIWNLGVMLWDLIEGDELFQRALDSRRRYDAKAHLAEMIALLGYPPPELMKRYQKAREIKWPERLRLLDGDLCWNTEEVFCGPFFDEQGNFLYKGLVPDRKLDDSLPSLEAKDREEFLAFVKTMLCWLPEERKTARELLDHPFLQLDYVEAL